MATAFQRKSIRLPRPNYQGHLLCFATLCFDQRAAFASDPAVAHWLIATLHKCASRKFFLTHAYCVMPDHMHFLIEGTGPNADVLSMARSFKQETGYLFSQRKHQRLWQTKWYDHLLRTGESLEAVCWYIWLNPVRKGICDNPRDYPFLGSFSDCGSRLSQYNTRPTWMPPWKTPN
jgi:putative transposase